MAGSIGKKEGQSAKEQHPPSTHPGHPIQGRIHAPKPKGGK
jgi:hypothetical protein